MFVKNIIAAVFQLLRYDKLVNWDLGIFESDEKLFYRTLHRKRVTVELRAIRALIYCTLTLLKLSAQRASECLSVCPSRFSVVLCSVGVLLVLVTCRANAVRHFIRTTLIRPQRVCADAPAWTSLPAHPGLPAQDDSKFDLLIWTRRRRALI